MGASRLLRISKEGMIGWSFFNHGSLDSTDCFRKKLSRKAAKQRYEESGVKWNLACLAILAS